MSTRFQGGLEIPTECPMTALGVGGVIIDNYSDPTQAKFTNSSTGAIVGSTALEGIVTRNDARDVVNRLMEHCEGARIIGLSYFKKQVCEISGATVSSPRPERARSQIPSQALQPILD